MPTNNTKTNKWTKDEVIGPSLAVARTLAIRKDMKRNKAVTSNTDASTALDTVV